MSRRLVTVLVLSAVCVWCSATAGFADGLGQVSCAELPQAGCDIKAGSPAEPPSGAPPQGSPDQNSEPGPADSGSNQASSDVDEPDCDQSQAQNVGPGSSQDAECRLFGGSQEDAGPVPAAARPSPEVLGRQAMSRLDIPTPVLGSSPRPGSRHVVGLPSWLWVDSSTWGEQSASASVPGLTVTATARPVAVSWSMGDGSIVDCRGAGTPWRLGMDARAASPDCGFTYRRSSASAPGGVYTVTATLTWSVSWSGGNQGGELDPLSTQASMTVRVVEAQGLNSAVAARSGR